VAATFGLMAMLSLPVAKLLPGPLRSVFGGLERILRPRIAAAPAFHPWPNPSAIQALPARSVAGQSPTGPSGGGIPGGPAQGSGGGTSSGGQVPTPPNTSGQGPPPVLGPGDLREEISSLDIHTLGVLGRMLRPLGRPPFRQLVRHSDYPDAMAVLVMLTAQKRLSDLPSTITPAELHWRLAELRKNLPLLREQALDRRSFDGPPFPASGRTGRGPGSSSGPVVATPTRASSTRSHHETRATGKGSRSHKDTHGHGKPPHRKHDHPRH